MGSLLLVAWVQYREIAVSVARKTDAAFWPALFQAIGAPSEILDNLVDVGALDSAACCLLCVDRIEGSAAAHSRALHLIRVSSLKVELNPLDCHCFPLSRGIF